MATKRKSAARAKTHHPSSEAEEAKRRRDQEKQRKDEAADNERRARAAERARQQSAEQAAAAQDADGEKQPMSGKAKVGIVVGCVAIVVIVVLVAWQAGLFGTTSASDDDASDDADTTETESSLVAATVNGEEISEDTITEEIEYLRSYYGYDEDEDWAEYLIDAGYSTVEELREEYIDSYVEEEVLAQAIEEYGVEVTEEEVEEQWDLLCSYYGDEEYFEYIIEAFYGYDKEAYLELLEDSLAEEALTEAVAPAQDVADDDVVEYLNENIDTYGESYYVQAVVFAVDDTSDADELSEALVLATHAYESIAAGEMTMEEAYSIYSEDDGYAVTALEDYGSDGVEWGWDCLNSLDSDVADALAGLGANEASEPVLGSDGYYIVMYTDSYSAGDAETDIANIPDAIVSYIQSVLVDEQVSEDYDAWYEEYYDAAEIVVNDMPDDLSYYVDLTEYADSDEEEDDGTDEDAEE